MQYASVVCRRPFCIGCNHGRHAGPGPEAGRHAAHLQSRQPAERVDPRGSHHLDGACRSWACSTTSSSSIHTSRSTARRRSCPILPTSWAWDATKTKLTFKLRHGVTWHDGKPFTAKDVKCTWNKLHRQGPGRLPQEPARVWYAQPRGGDGQRRPRGRPSISRRRSPRCWRCSPRATRRSIRATSRRGHARQADRHRPVQVRRVQAQRDRSSSCAIPTTGRRASPTSTASSARVIDEPLDARPGLRRRRVRHDVYPDVTIPLLKD